MKSNEFELLTWCFGLCTGLFFGIELGRLQKTAYPNVLPELHQYEQELKWGWSDNNPKIKKHKYGVRFDAPVAGPYEVYLDTVSEAVDISTMKLHPGKEAPKK